MSDTKNKKKFPYRKAIGVVLALTAGILYYTGISEGQEAPPLQTFISTEENTDKDKSGTQEEIQTEIPNGDKTADLSSNQAVLQIEDRPVGLININTAEKNELCTLKGIGTSKADRIIEYREMNGGFKTIEEIMRVPGIKEGIFLKIKDCITI